MNRPIILDTTLRDGSYVIDFQFSSSDTAVIVAELASAGVEYIEVGHGLGLGASRNPDMRAAETDLAYLEAAGAAAGSARWGCFLIPGIANLEDLYGAASSGMKFARIGTDITDVERSLPFIEAAKDLGLEVFANFMKSYAVDVKYAQRQALLASRHGADHVCIVDSAGGMLPEEVALYVHAVAVDLELSTGFHGHNNLGLAIANGLAAVAAGASIVDCSLRGMGRSAGNTVTEIFALALRRLGKDPGIDVNRILSLAERVIDPLVVSYNQTDSLGVISGYAQFHSSFLGKVLTYAEKHRADPRELIIALTSQNLISAPEDLLEELAMELRDTAPDKMSNIHVPLLPPPVMEGTSVERDLDELTKRISTSARKWRKKSVLNILSPSSSNRPGSVSPVVYEGPHFVIGSAELTSVANLEETILKAAKNCDYLLVDVGWKPSERTPILDQVPLLKEQKNIIQYSDCEIWLRAVVRTVRNLCSELGCSQIKVLGDSTQAHLIREVLADLNTGVSPPEFLASTGTTMDLYVVCNQASQVDWSEVTNSVVLTAVVDALSPSDNSVLTASGNLVLTLEMHRELHAEIDAQLTSSMRLQMAMTNSEYDEVEVVAGGRVGKRGSVVVDSLPRPTRVLGVADGAGHLIPESILEAEHLESMQIVRQRIVRERV